MLPRRSRADIPSVMLSFVVMGYKGTGKTSLTQRFVHNALVHPESTSVSVDAAFYSKILMMKSLCVHFLVWDCPGSNKCRDMLPVFYSSSQVALLCFRDTPDSCQFVKSLASEILEQTYSNNIRVIALVRTHSNEPINQQTGDAASVKQYAEDKQLQYYEVDSCREDDKKIARMFADIGRLLIDGHPHLTAPEWVPDADATSCTFCDRQFSTFRRRHHCRNCGHLFCASCSSRFVQIERLETQKAVRVCDNCYDVVAQ